MNVSSILRVWVFPQEWAGDPLGKVKAAGVRAHPESTAREGERWERVAEGSICPVSAAER